MSSRDMVNEVVLFKIYQALGNPHRRRIITLLGENPEGLTFSELKKMMDLSVGSLYYNLDQLDGLVYQKSDKRYALTEKGFLAFEMLKNDVESLKSGMELRGLIGFATWFHRWLFPRWFFLFLEQRKRAMPLIALAVLAVGAFMCGANGIILNITWVGYTSATLLASLSFIWSWLLIAVVPFVIAAHNVKGRLKLLPQHLAEVGVAMTPLLVFVAVDPFLRSILVVKVIVQVVMWLLSIILASSALSHSIRCRSEVAFLITVLVMFVATLIVSQLTLVTFLG